MKAGRPEFPVLNNPTIRRNIATFRKLRHKKAWEVAEYLGLKEATYTKYERGESQITIELLQRVAELLQVNPLKILLADPDHYVESLEAPLPGDSSEIILETLRQLKRCISETFQDDTRVHN